MIKSVCTRTLFSDLVKTLRETTEKVYIIPTHAAFTEVAKRFLRGELPGYKGLYKVIGGKDPQSGGTKLVTFTLASKAWRATSSMPRYTANLPSSSQAPIKFNNDSNLPNAALDKIFREIAWKAVVEHPLSGVTDENKNGVGDHLE